MEMLDFTFGSRQNSLTPSSTSSHNPFMKINNQILNSNYKTQKSSFANQKMISSVLKQLFEVISYNFDFLQKSKFFYFSKFLGNLEIEKENGVLRSENEFLKH